MNWKKLLQLLAVLFGLMTGCTAPMTYDEMTEAVKTAPPEERAALKQRIRKFEQDVERAEAFFENKAACERSQKAVWFCTDPRYNDRQIDRTLRSGSLDDIVRVYRGLRTSCGCMEAKELFR